MEAGNKIKLFGNTDYLHLVILSVLSVFFLNYFFDLTLPILIIEGLIVSALITLLLLRYKTLLLFGLTMLVPLAIPVSIGSSKINFPTELICVLLTGFFFLKIFSGYKLNRQFLKHPITILILLDLVWMLVTSFTSQAPEVSFKRLFIRTIYYISFYYFYFELFKKNTGNTARVFLLHCVGMLIPVMSTMIFHARFNFSSLGAQRASSPFYNDHTMYGAALAFFIPFLVLNAYKSHRNLRGNLFYSGLMLVFLVAAFLSYSRAAWISLIIAGVLSVILKYRIGPRFIIMIAFVAGIAAFSNREKITDVLTKTKDVSNSENVETHFKSISNLNTDVSNKERINRWKCALRMFADKPVFGFGPGTYQFYYGAYQVRKDMTTISTFTGLKGHAHSEYLNYLSETGLPGLLIFISLIGTVCCKALKLIKKSNDKHTRQTVLYILPGLITFFVHAFFNGFIEFDKLAMPVFVSYAAIVSLDLQNNSHSTENK